MGAKKAEKGASVRSQKGPNIDFLLSCKAGGLKKCFLQKFCSFSVRIGQVAMVFGQLDESFEGV